MSWDPGVTVTVGATTFTSTTVDAVQITYGRTNVWEQARTGYASITLVSLSEIYPNVEINANVVITINNSTGSPITVFTGKLNNVESSRQAQGLIQGVTYHRLTAVGPFAKMSRSEIAGSNYPKEMDDDRMDRILTEAGVTIDVVDTPGIYELEARDGNLIDAYSIASTTANSIFGYIYETTDGKVGYANQSRRLNEVQDNGYYEIPKSIIQWNSFRTSRNLANVLNSVSIDWRAGTANSTNPSSISLYGLADGQFSTDLHNLTDAQNLADFYIATRSFPQTNVSSFNVQLESGLLTNAIRNALIGIYMGKPIEIPGLPTSLYDDTYTGFVEGWTLTANRKQATISLTTTDSTLTIVPTRWQDVDPTTEWADVGATIRWFAYE